jgi:MFS transporter, PHS family, inorganic phosphate transporter
MVSLSTTPLFFKLLDIPEERKLQSHSFVKEFCANSAFSNVYKQFYNTAVGNIIIVCAGAIPGYWVTVALVDTVGRKPIQLMGFTLLTILFCIFGFAYYKISDHGLFAIYVLAQFFFNFGPNSTTFIVPGECFPTRYRSSSHGISAAAGKIGSIVAQALIGPLRTRGATSTNASPWINHVMEIFALFMLCGVFTTLLIPETKRKTLEQLAGEVPGTPEFDPNNVRGVQNAKLMEGNGHHMEKEAIASEPEQVV